MRTGTYVRTVQWAYVMWKIGIPLTNHTSSFCRRANGLRVRSLYGTSYRYRTVGLHTGTGTGKTSQNTKSVRTQQMRNPVPYGRTDNIRQRDYSSRAMIITNDIPSRPIPIGANLRGPRWSSSVVGSRIFYSLTIIGRARHIPYVYKLDPSSP